MKTLEKIIEKYSKVECNENNYEVGGGLVEYKSASNRHEDALNDAGKLTFGKAAAMFKKATGCPVEFVNEIFWYAVPNPEWHHAGFLPKAYGGGMKKTYFLNAKQIVYIASNWEKLVQSLEISKQEKMNKEELKKAKEMEMQQYLEANATYHVRILNAPKYFYTTKREMNGKYGWFDSTGKTYRLPEYLTGWAFENEEKFETFRKMLLEYRTL